MRFNEQQLAEIALIQEQRSLTRKSAAQFYSRQLKKRQAESAKEMKPTAPAKTGKPEEPARKPTARIELSPVAEIGGVYTTQHGGKKVVVCYVARNRATADDRFDTLTISEKRFEAAQKSAKTLALEMFVGAQVNVAGRWDSGWLVTAKLFKQTKCGELDFNLSGVARAAYAADQESQAGNVRFEIKEAK